MPSKYIKIADRKADEGGPRKQRKKPVPPLRNTSPDNVQGTPGELAKEPDVLRQVIQSIQLRKGGASYRNIGQNLGISEKTAAKYVKEEMERLTEEVQEAARAHRQLQLERLNEMMLGYWPRRGDPKYGAMIMACMAKQDQLLGIAAEKIDLTVTQNDFEKMSNDDLDKFLAQKMAALKKPEPVNKTVQ